MIDLGIALLAGLLAYLIGAFPTGVIVSKLWGGPDVRFHGSGHTGARNTLRLMGSWAGGLVLVVDGLKGLLAWAVAYTIMMGNSWALPIAGVMAIIGHCWPVYTGFRGGLGLATGGGLWLIQTPLIVLVTVVLWAFFLRFYQKQYKYRSIVVALMVGLILTLGFVPLRPSAQLLVVSVFLVMSLRHMALWNYASKPEASVS